MATKQSKGKNKTANKEAGKKAPAEPKKDAIYTVAKPVWIRMIHRFPGYLLKPEDIGFLKNQKTFELQIKRGVIKEA